MLMDFKIGKYWEKAKSEIVDSIREDYTPHTKQLLALL